MDHQEHTGEEARLADRAAAIWGNPFSPEVMAQDAALRAAEREGLRTNQRHTKMSDLEWSGDAPE